MYDDRPPSEITEEGTYWARSRDVSDSPEIGGDAYFDRHDVASGGRDSIRPAACGRRRRSRTGRAGTLWAAKAMTAFGHEELPYDEYLLTVYTPNYFATHDVERPRTPPGRPRRH